MLGYIRTQALGNVTRDLELKTTTTGKKVVSFTIAVNSKQEGETDYLDCVAWEKTGELLAQYLMKGKPIELHGKLKQRNFEVDGVRRSKLELIVNEFYFIGGDRKEENRPITQNQVLEKSGDFVVQDIDDKPISLDDIPFN